MNTLTTIAEVVNFPVPGLGTAANQRVGNRIEGVGIKIKLLLHNNTSVPIHVRFLILKIPQGQRMDNARIQSELFETSGSTAVGETSASPVGPTADLIRQVNRGEIQVIRDKVVPLNASTVDTGMAMEEIYVRTPGMFVFPDSDTTEPIDNRFVFVLIPRRSDNDEATGSNVEFTFCVTKYFKDC